MNAHTTKPTPDEDLSVTHDILSEVFQTAKADACLFVRIVEIDGRLYYTGVQVVGDARLGRQLEGRPVSAAGTQLVRRPSDVDRFTDLCPRVHLVDGAAPTALDEASGALQLLVFDEDTCVGALLALRWSPQTGFDELTRHQLDKRVGTFREALVSAQRDRPAAPESMYVICRRTGEIVGGCSLANPWLDRSRRKRLQALVAGFADPNKALDGPHLVDRMLAQLSPIRDHDDFTMIIVRLERVTAAKMAPDASLTPTQREVAEFAIAGATASEIADTMGRSVHTVRTHLKNIYERLHVASRVELLEVLRG